MLTYRARLVDVEGKSFHFNGAKELDDGDPLNLAKEMTTLNFTLRRDEPDGPEIGRGVVKIGFWNGLRVFETVRVLHMENANEDERLGVEKRFAEWALGRMPLFRAAFNAAHYVRRRLTGEASGWGREG